MTKERYDENLKKDIWEKQLSGKAAVEKTAIIHWSLEAIPNGAKLSPMMMREVTNAPLQERIKPNSNAKRNSRASNSRHAAAIVSVSLAGSRLLTSTADSARSSMPKKPVIAENSSKTTPRP
jgi:hypothetical protein